MNSLIRYTVEVWDWISNFVAHFRMDVIAYPFPDATEHCGPHLCHLGSLQPILQYVCPNGGMVVAIISLAGYITGT